MSRLDVPPLNEAYLLYEANPTSENYEILGEALMPYIEATIAKLYGSQFIELEDQVGEVCVEVIQGLPKYVQENKGQSKGRFDNWVYTITRNTCLDSIKKRRAQREEELEAIDPEFHSYDFFSSKDAKLDLERLVSQLPAADQELVEMKLHGLSNDEIAAELDTTEGYIEVRWNRLTKKLRTLGGW